MTIRTDNSQGGDKPDALREAYLNAVADDRGPSAQSSAAILAHARQRAESMANPAPEKAAQFVKPSTRPAANDRFWLRHALGGLAAVGLVGWLMLQHAAWWDGTDKGVGAEPPAPVAARAPQRTSPVSPAAETSVAAADVSEASEAVAADAASVPAAASVAAPSTDAKLAANGPANAAELASARAGDRKDAAKSIPVAPQAPRASAIAKSANTEEAAPAYIDQASAAMEKSIPAPANASAKHSFNAKKQAEIAPSTVGDASAQSMAKRQRDVELPLCPEFVEESPQPAPANHAKDGKAMQKSSIEEPVACRPRRPANKHRMPKPQAPDAGADSGAGLLNPPD